MSHEHPTGLRHPQPRTRGSQHPAAEHQVRGSPVHGVALRGGRTAFQATWGGGDHLSVKQVVQSLQHRFLTVGTRLFTS